MSMPNPALLARLLDIYPTLGLTPGETVGLLHLLVLAEDGQVDASVANLARRMARHPSSVKRLLARLKGREVITRTATGTLAFTDIFKERLLWAK
jgi:DNA-binding MarR family transcriptional regulator